MTFTSNWIWPDIISLAGALVRPAEKLSFNSSLLSLQTASESAKVNVGICKRYYYHAVKLCLVSDDPK